MGRQLAEYFVACEELFVCSCTVLVSYVSSILSGSFGFVAFHLSEDRGPHRSHVKPLSLISTTEVGCDPTHCLWIKTPRRCKRFQGSDFRDSDSETLPTPIYTIYATSSSILDLTAMNGEQVITE